MSPNHAYVVLGTTEANGLEKVCIDTLHTTSNRAATRIKKLEESGLWEGVNFSILRTHFGHRHDPIYVSPGTSASDASDDKNEGLLNALHGSLQSFVTHIETALSENK